MTDWVLVDTDVLIDIGRSVAEAITCLQQIEQQASPTISHLYNTRLGRAYGETQPISE